MKTILITGATSGIGLAAAKKLANEKNQLILCGRRQRKLDEISEELSKSVNVLSLCFDISNKNEVNKLLSNLPKSWKLRIQPILPILYTLGLFAIIIAIAVSYTHLTLPTKRIV